MLYKRTDPLQVLPYELWLECIRLYARDQPEGPLPLLWVSAAWQRRLLESPVIWTTIYFDGGDDVESRAECFFHLSKTSPVTLVVGETPGTMKRVIKYGHRIHSIVFWTKHKPSDTNFAASLLIDRYNNYWCSTFILIDINKEHFKYIYTTTSQLSAFPALITVLERQIWSERCTNKEKATINLAAMHYYLSLREKAEELGQEALRQLAKSSHAINHSAMVVAHLNLAIILEDKRKMSEDTKCLFKVVSRLAESHASRNRQHEACTLYSEVISLQRRLLGTTDTDTIQAAEKLLSASSTPNDPAMDALDQELRLCRGIQYL